MIQRTLVCVVLCGFMMAGSLLAHHSLAGVYDMKKDMELSGAVEAVMFVNPHGSLKVAVKNEDGSSTTWVLTMGSATSLAQRGIGKTGANALHNGDSIKVKFIPARDGSPIGFLKSVTFPDGHVIVVSAGGPND